ncbi:uncharacterized protein LOC142177258 [Nicotiana tabacum]|uniref:Uncharacterized protein LOC142177258 n=1 Tax=Nicotiana tabacum TaxID=4097 RepID=A0AC58TX86_TOBAC
MPEVEKEAVQVYLQTQDLWVLYTDSESNIFGSGLGLVLKIPTGKVIRQSIRCPDMINNEAEYEDVIAGLRLALKYGAKQLKIHCDSQLVVNHVTGTFQIKEQRLQKYQIKICKVLPEFDKCQLDQIPCGKNTEVDGLA